MATQGGEADSAAAKITIPIGAPAEAETAAAVTATVQSVFACFDEFNVLGAHAYFTDDLIALFGPEPGTPRSDTEAFLAGDFEDEEDGEESSLVSVANAMVLEDGRVGAFVIERYSSGDAVSVGKFEQVNGRWLVDEILELPTLGDEA